MKSNVQMYLQLVEDLKTSRNHEAMLLDKMDFLWQAMSLEEREQVRNVNQTWPPPVDSDPEEV